MTLWQLVSNVLSVIFLDLALGGDNAAVIAMAAKNLERQFCLAHWERWDAASFWRLLPWNLCRFLI